jgi:hypothetical protein
MGWTTYTVVAPIARILARLGPRLNTGGHREVIVKYFDGLSGKIAQRGKGHVAALLECDESDVDAALAEIGMERCGECGVWYAQSDCDIAHPDRPMDFICHSCVGHLGVVF